MRKIIAFLCIVSFNAVAGLPPTSLTGEQAAPNVTTFNFKAPNYQATKISATDSRIETGNSNILVNPSFEHSTYNTGWTNASGSVSVETTAVTDGKKSMNISSSSIGTDVNQISTLNAANLKGQQMMLMVDVKNNDPIAQVCAVVDSVDTNCVTVPLTDTNTPFKTIQIPFVAGGTNNGFRIKSATTTAGLITYIDNVFVGKSNPFQNVSGAQFLGQITYSGCTAAWSTSSTSFTTLTATSGCTITTLGSVSAAGSQIPAIVLPGGGSGLYSFHLSGYMGQLSGSAAGNPAALLINDGTNDSAEYNMYSGVGSTTVASSNAVMTLNYSTSFTNKTFQVLAKSFSSSNTVGVSAIANQKFTISVYYYPPQSKIYSTASPDYDWTSYTPTFTGFGTVTGVSAYHKRKGSDLYLRVNFTCGTPTAVEAQMTLPTGLTTASTIPTLQVAGWGNQTAVSNNRYDFLMQPSVSFLNFGNQGNIAGVTKALGNNFCGASNAVSLISGPIPIQGWQDYGVIVGSFQYVPQVPGQSNVDTFSFSYGTGSLNSQCTASPCSYLDQIGNVVSSVTRTAVGNYTFNFNKTYSRIKCVAIGNGSAAMVYDAINCASCSSVSTVSRASVSAAAIDSAGSVYCQGSY